MLKFNEPVMVTQPWGRYETTVKHGVQFHPGHGYRRTVQVTNPRTRQWGRVKHGAWDEFVTVQKKGQSFVYSHYRLTTIKSYEELRSVMCVSGWWDAMGEEERDYTRSRVRLFIHGQMFLKILFAGWGKIPADNWRMEMEHLMGRTGNPFHNLGECLADGLL